MCPSQLNNKNMAANKDLKLFRGCAVQSWLQRFSWTEQLVKSRMARRNALPKDKTLLSAEPMFCFETAVKMLYWSAFVYELDEVRCSLSLTIDHCYHQYQY